ncbi:hypothetical protein [Pseudodesulfovibrio tunisiensis]|uniref:hypothetical protein n=1 Tax=Pseudodesulfovibrio tunisiensis TaxID=463192 RepID=UPI001FB2662C|nr:hypothetical protein [Pseudodesulfovibrio tunisiensis]
MKKHLLTFGLLALLCMAIPAQADNLDYYTRDMADSEYRMAEKSVRKAKADYGENLDNVPAEKRASICRELSAALHDNRIQLNRNDFFTKQQYRKQVDNLQVWTREMGCLK